jgi:hypothetical protein
MLDVATTFNNGPVELHNFQEEVIMRLQLRGGNVVVRAKVQLKNNDDDSQDFTARITHGDGSVELDRVDVRLGDHISTCACLSGWITNATAGDTLDLRCSTYKGNATMARMAAIMVDELT